MNRRTLSTLAVFACAVAGCTPGPPVLGPRHQAIDPTAQRKGVPSTQPAVPRRTVDRSGQEDPRFTGITAEDRRFAAFLREKGAGMVHQASVSAKEEGQIRVQLDSSVAPDETLPLTKSLMAGARKDFPGRALTLAMYDPKGEPILTAIYQPDQGVRYRIAHDGKTNARRDEPASRDGARPRPPSETEPLTRGGTTAADRQFAGWAEEHGKAYLRYVQSDLERNGRLWFGVTRETKPADVPDLTRSLLEGAMKDFPGRALVATVFDPEGEKIGTAHMDPDGRLKWEK